LNTNLTKTVLIGVELEGANINNAILKDTKFREVRKSQEDQECQELKLSERAIEALKQLEEIKKIVAPPEE
jgi:uncharacterized protein YjbI with pentapeptide repeats